MNYKNLEFQIVVQCQYIEQLLCNMCYNFMKWPQNEASQVKVLYIIT
jgi:hypothetical protein